MLEFAEPNRIAALIASEICFTPMEIWNVIFLAYDIM
jgi:hypothetical protein